MAADPHRRQVVTLVVNPKAGRARAIHVLPKVEKALRNGLPDSQIRIVRATSYEDARNQANRAVADSTPPAEGGRPDVLVMVGGDGMAALGLNACAGSPVRLAVIPMGTGDDFVHGAGMPRKPMDAVQAIINGRTKFIDLSLVTGDIVGGDTQRYVGSIVSTGYDAMVNHRVNKMKVRFGTLSYAWALLAEMAELRPRNYRLVIDGERLETRAVIAAVGNAGYVGGGIHLTPAADVTDGLLDIMLIAPVSRWTLIRLFPLLFRTGFVKHPAITQRRAREVIVDGDDLVPMADGEELGRAPLRVRCEPGALTIVVGDDE
ncbi:diacylglycerol kinase family protein [Propionimicrobium sp. PCR01-08-3]|uniref:diacylglycerol/lipid kinase family protein n=1 Tax=Propionimicrobium sp. PCR01-08-3 TaxID=3052086 RepID=UPI00255C457A|nr:diacylglycerol kinase family protein [Propionimicrobium sp. PCR01-08-3]WIY83615.1 diacylglycerol kinase family protein [Propionimicrobium sp. PCR01-08-3]